MARPQDQTYDSTEIEARLTGPLAHWRLEDGAIARTYRTHGWKATLMVVNTIGHLAEAAWHHPDLEVGYGKVIVRLTNHDAGGVSDKCFALAEKIESVVQWQPGREGGPLEGTPTDDKRHAYIRYDD